MTLDGSSCKQRSLIECMQFIMEVTNTLKVSLCSQTVYEFNDYEFNDYEFNDYEFNDYEFNDYKFNDLVPGTLPGIIITAFSNHSSLSLHTSTSTKNASLNIFSTKPFSQEVIEKAFRYFFKPEKLVVGGS